MDRIELGQSVDVTITIRPTFRWRSSSGGNGDTLKLAYSVTYNIHEWLVVGQVQGDFEAREGEEHSSRLSLVPLIAGALFLPSLVIQPAESASTPATPPVTCETQHITAAFTVEVIPVKHRTTFEIPSSPSFAETYASYAVNLVNTLPGLCSTNVAITAGFRSDGPSVFHQSKLQDLILFLRPRRLS